MSRAVHVGPRPELWAGMPFGYLVVWARLVTVGRDYEEAALTLGTNDLETAWKVTIPLLGACPHGLGAPVRDGSFEFSATQFLVVLQTQTIPVQIYSAASFLINFVGKPVNLRVKIGRQAPSIPNRL